MKRCTLMVTDFAWLNSNGDALRNWMGSVKHFVYKTPSNLHRLPHRLFAHAWSYSQRGFVFIFIVCTFAYPLACTILSRLGFRRRQKHSPKRRQIFPVSARTLHLEILRWIFPHKLGQDTRFGSFQKLHTRLSSARCDLLRSFRKLRHGGHWIFKTFPRNYFALDEFRYAI